MMPWQYLNKLMSEIPWAERTYSAHPPTAVLCHFRTRALQHTAALSGRTLRLGTPRQRVTMIERSSCDNLRTLASQSILPQECVQRNFGKRTLEEQKLGF